MELNEMLGDLSMAQFLLKCKLDFEFFCDNVLPDIFDPKYGGIQDYMMDWFRMIQKNDRLIIEAARGFAKTTILGVAYPLWLVFTQEKKQIMIISASEGQAKRVLSIIKKTIEQNPLLKEVKPDDFKETWSSKEIKTKTNCRIFSKPFTKSVLGERVDYVLGDEANKWENPELFFDYVVPTLNPHGKIVLISSSEGGISVINMVKERSKIEDVGYTIRKYPAIKNGQSIWAKRFPLKTLKKIEREQGKQYFQKNFMCNPISEGDRSIFSASSIELAKDRSASFSSKVEEGKEIYVGCDFAMSTGPTADYDVYIVIEKIGERAKILHGERHKGIPLPEKIRLLEKIHQLFNPISFICDESGIGGEVIRELRQKGIPAEAQSFQSTARNEILNNLKSVLDNGRIKIPANPNDIQTKTFLDVLEDELLAMAEKKLETRTSYQSTAAHDDTVMALAMALKKVKSYKGVQDYWSIK